MRSSTRTGCPAGGRTRAKTRSASCTSPPGRSARGCAAAVRSRTRSTITMRTFTDGEWDTLLGVVGTQLGHAAALLDGELPGALAEQAREAGADLLPGPGDLRPRVFVPGFGEPVQARRGGVLPGRRRGRPRPVHAVPAARTPAGGRPDRAARPPRTGARRETEAAEARGRGSLPESRLHTAPGRDPGAAIAATGRRLAGRTGPRPAGRARAGRRRRCPASPQTRRPWPATC